MEHYAGLDVSLKEISICVVDEDGAVRTDRVVHSGVYPERRGRPVALLGRGARTADPPPKGS